MSCPNKAKVCLCAKPGEARRTLANIFNGGLHPEEIRVSRKMGEDPNTTEEQAVRRLRELEYGASCAYGMWENSQ